MFYIFIITILTGIDQWTKYLVETQLKPIGAIPIVLLLTQIVLQQTA